MVIDTIAKRYGVLPSQVINLNIEDYTFNQLICVEAFENEKKQMEKANRKQGRI
jgi:hypothetical protein